MQLLFFIFAYLGLCNRQLNSLYITSKYRMSVAKNSLDNTGHSSDAIDWDVYIDPKAGLHPATEALQALKYESEDPDANARSYKEEGNYYYKGKDFSKAILSYTGGLRAKSSDRKLNAILYTNRAVCHFYLKNYRSCIRDCKSAVSLSPDYVKAYVKGIEACLALSKIDEALELSSTGLNVLPSSPELLEVQYRVLKKQMELDKEVEQRSKLGCRKENDMNTEYEILKVINQFLLLIDNIELCILSHLFIITYLVIVQFR
ncbi:unnamed protein product [Schistosoma margrebowiei]|uniref:Uncharacterized protein n=1 Tax=Schistosoma margrebowiei TaxID=48269 RepID=A0A3P8DR88_9TREM|nr:unnamed protein product [Schistosoma margrebowiei]